MIKNNLMVYQLNGKFGPFTLETNNDLNILACQYKLSTDNSVYVVSPVLISSKLDHILYNIELQKYFPNGIGEYIDNNIATLLSILSDFIPGYAIDRTEYQNSIIEINAEDMSAEDKEAAIDMIRSTYQNMYQEHAQLFNRIVQVKSILEYRLKQITVPNIVDEDETV